MSTKGNQHKTARDIKYDTTAARKPKATKHGKLNHPLRPPHPGKLERSERWQ